MATPDLNDPNIRMDRASAMNAMRERRRETVAKDMTADDAKEFLASPLALTTTTASEDVDGADAAAAAERARLEAEAAKTEAKEEPKEEPKAELAAKKEEPEKKDEGLDAASQTKHQSEDLILTDDDLRQVKVKVKINGQERLLTGEELRNEAQKVASGDEFLKLAKEVLGGARTAAATPAAAEVKTEVEAEPDIGVEVDAAVDAVFAGKDEEVKANFKKAFLKMRPTSAKPAGVTQEQLRAMEQFLVTRSELRQFGKDHKDLMDDEGLRFLCDQRVKFELQAIGVQELEQLPAERIHDVLERVADHVNAYNPKRVQAAPAGGTASTLSERLKRKSSVDELPAAATRNATQVPQPKTTTDVINDMRRARGQLPATTA